MQIAQYMYSDAGAALPSSPITSYKHAAHTVQSVFSHTQHFKDEAGLSMNQFRSMMNVFLFF